MAKRTLLIATLIPLFLSLSYCIIIDDVNADEVETKSSQQIFTAGSTIIITHFEEGGDWIPPTIIGDLHMEYTLKDANNDVVWKWETEPDAYEFRAGYQMVRDRFEFEIPMMWGRPSGQWTLTAKIKDDAGNEDISLGVNYLFQVKSGGIWENVNAPIYIYHSKTSFIFFESKFAMQLPSLLMLISPVIIFIVVFFLLKYMKFAVKEGKEVVSLSRSSIKKARTQKNG